jgi:hypothetical protein
MKGETGIFLHHSRSSGTRQAGSNEPIKQEEIMKEQHQIIKFRIIRRTSKYNKYIKWFVECTREDGSQLSTSGYRTQREARDSIPKHPSKLPMGNQLIVSHYVEV